MVASRISRIAVLLAMAVFLPEVADAQELNEHCTVSVLNRTVQVKPDGSWVLPNVPANFGPVRARATCIIDGRTVSGESDLFVVPANGVVNLPSIRFGSSTPIPTLLTLSAPNAVITALGGALQLTATARYPDSTTSDVTAANTGTQYTVSNPLIATVSADGVVQAISSGAVVIQATQEGASGMIAVRIAPGGADTDGDGIPDSVELALGLDPNNPVDASEDFDRDDLSNLQESVAGTDIRRPDTDGDGLSDGNEVAGGTNPLLADTDGDRIPDGVERTTGTSPTSAASYDLRAASASSVVLPSSFRLTTSALLPVASQQLIWRVTLIDGTTVLDLTSDSRTSFSSNNLAACSFGATKGLVFAGTPGVCTITVSQNTLSATVAGTVEAFTPRQVANFSVPGAVAVDVNGTFAYVAAGQNGVVVVDVSNAGAPSRRGTLSGIGDVRAVRARGSVIFVTDLAGNLRVVQVTNPDAPVLVGSVPIAGAPIALAVAGDLVAVAAQAGGVSLIDVSNSAAPVLIRTFSVSGAPVGIDLNSSGTLAAVAMRTAGVQLVSVSAPASPVLRGSVAGGDVRQVRFLDTALLLADVARSVTAVNITNPDSPVLVFSLAPSLGGGPVDIAVFGTVAMTADISFGAAVPVLTVADPLRPQTALFWTMSPPAFSSSIAMDSRYGYLITPNSLRIFHYQDIVDNAGAAPDVRIVSPSATVPVVHGSTIPIEVSAIDDVAVARVQLTVNGLVVATGNGTPARFSITAPAVGSTLTLGATALDFANNLGTATPVVLSLIPDPLTTVVGVVRYQGAGIGGAEVTCGGLAATTGGDGAFTVAGVTTLTPVVCRVRAQVGATILGGGSLPVDPVRGGTTSIGTIDIGPVPVVLSISPKLVDGGNPPTSLQITGVNLTGATFAFVPSAGGAITVGTAVVNASGTEATIPVTVAPTARGRFALVGTNGSGSGDPALTAGNTLTVINAGDDVDTDADGFPDGLELLFGSDPANPASLPNFSTSGTVTSAAVSVVNTALPVSTTQDVVSPTVSVVNTLLPVASLQDVISPAVSIVNTVIPGISANDVLGAAVAVLNSPPVTPGSVTGALSGALGSVSAAQSAAAQVDIDARRTASGLDLLAMIVQPTGGTRVVAGDTLVVKALVSSARPLEQVEFLLNGEVVPISSLVSPFSLAFTVPTGIGTITIGLRAVDVTGQQAVAEPITVSIMAADFVGLTGRAVDEFGQPVAGATVELVAQGLRAEYFSSPVPLTRLLDLTGRAADRIGQVSSFNVVNPGAAFAGDVLRTGLAPGYGGRLSGFIVVPESGRYTFHLGTDEGARLTVGEAVLIEMPGNAGAYSERSAAVELTAGLVPIEVQFFHNIGPGRLHLWLSKPGQSRRFVTTGDLVARVRGGQTDVTGAFRVDPVRSFETGLAIRVWVTQGGSRREVVVRPNLREVAKQGTHSVGVLVMPSGPSRER